MCACILTNLCGAVPAQAGEADKIRTGIDINESAFIKKQSDGSYRAVIGPDKSEFIITGSYDGSSKLMAILNSAGADMLGCVLESDAEGNWKCTVPTTTLYREEVNRFSIVYYDDFSVETVCFIQFDTSCEFEINAAYESDDQISGITEPGAKVEVVCGSIKKYAIADENGHFSVRINLDAVETDAECYVEVADLCGNKASRSFSIIDVDISLFAHSVISTDNVQVVINAIPDSEVQLIFNGKKRGSPVFINEGGSGSATIDGLQHGYGYEITAEYVGEHRLFGVAAQPIKVVVDRIGPTVKGDGQMIDEDVKEINVYLEEACTLVFSEETTGITVSMAAHPGKNKIVFNELPDPIRLSAGMRLRISAFDDAGNESMNPLEYEVMHPISDVMFVSGMTPEGNMVDAMDKTRVSGRIYVQNEEYMLDVYILGYESDMSRTMGIPSYTSKMNVEPLTAITSDSGAKLPAYISFDLSIDADTLPLDYSYEMVFHVRDSIGRDLYPYDRLKIGFALEKDSEWLMTRLMIMSILGACFIIMLLMYVMAGNRYRKLKRINGSVRKGTRAGKRGGV